MPEIIDHRRHAESANDTTISSRARIILIMRKNTLRLAWRFRTRIKEIREKEIIEEKQNYESIGHERADSIRARIRFSWDVEDV